MSTCSHYFHQSNFSTTTSIVRMQVRVISTRSLNAQPRQYLNRQDTSIDHAESTQHNDCYNAGSANTLALHRGMWNCNYKRRGLICSFTTWLNLWMGVCLYRIDYTNESLLTPWVLIVLNTLIVFRCDRLIAWKSISNTTDILNTTLCRQDNEKAMIYRFGYSFDTRCADRLTH